MNRGCLTESQYKKYGLTQAEVRLMPYLQYCLMNDRRLDLRRVSKDELKILDKWAEEGKISYGLLYLVCTKEFWDFMAEILWLSYADFENNWEDER